MKIIEKMLLELAYRCFAILIAICVVCLVVCDFAKVTTATITGGVIALVLCIVGLLITAYLLKTGDYDRY